jgi:hypothetical protein
MPPSPKPPSPAELALGEAQNLLQLWLRAKGFLAKATSEEPITRDDEQQFLETKSEISKAQRVMAQKIPADVSFGAERMQEILRQSISINHLRNLPKTDKNMLAANWHFVFINLSRAMGALQFLAEGYVAPERKKGPGTGIKDMKGAASSEASKPKKKSFFASPLFWIIVLAAAGAGYYFFVK